MENPRFYIKIAVFVISIYGTFGLFSCKNSRVVEKVECGPIYYESESENSICFQLQTDLAEQVADGNIRGVKETLGKGANVNGSYGSHLPIIVIAADRGNDSMVEFLLQQGADINRMGSSLGPSPLTAAVWNHHSTTVKLLLSHGADVCQVIEGTTPIQIARQGGSDEIIQLLIDAGADKCSR